MPAEGATQHFSGAAQATENVAQLVREAAASWADRPAFILPGGGANGAITPLSFAELGALMDAFAAGLNSLELPQGSRLMLLTPPTPEIYALALAVLRAGHVLVTVDGRASRKRILHALNAARADVVVAAPRAMRWWPLLGALRRARRFTAGRPVPGSRGLTELRDLERAPPPPADVDPTDTAVITFSSGNTGPAKRIERSHALLAAQHAALREAFPTADEEINLPGFPLLVLHSLSLGVTTVLPTVDLRSMAAADPTTVIQAIRACGVTSMSAAPAFVGSLASALARSGETLSQVRRLVIGGGPVSRRLARAVLATFPNAEAHIVYGATEAEPMATAPLTELLPAGENESGYLAGWPVAGLEFLIDGAPGAGAAPGGELLVRGAHVLPSGHPEGWHRTGDICRVDESGRLWLLGRVGAEIKRGGRTLHPFPLEGRALDHPGVAGAALVMHRAAPEGELLVELAPGVTAAQVLSDLRRLAAAEGLGELSVRQIDHVPMDARHQSKVDRQALIKRLAGSRR